MEKNDKIPGAMAAAKKAPPKKTGRQIPYAGKVHDVLTDGTTQPAQKVAVEEITQEQTGTIDLHLKGPEDVETIITREVEKLNDGFHVVIFNPEQNKLKPRQKIELLKDTVMGKPNESGERSGGLIIAGESDEAGYKKLDDTRKMLVKLRTGVSNKHKLLKENYLKVGRALDGEKNELTNLLSPIEKYCEDQLKVIDDIKAEKQRELERQKELKKQARINEIKQNGMSFDGAFYSIGENISLDIVTLENLNDEQYAALLKRVAEENKKILFAAYKREQRQRVERYLFERKQRKQAAEAQRLANIANQQKSERKADRVDILAMLGFTEHPSKQYYQLTNAAGSVIITVSDLETLEGEQWRGRFMSVKSEIEQLNKKLSEKEEADKKEKLKKERFDKLISIGCKFAPQTGIFYFEAGEKVYEFKTVGYSELNETEFEGLLSSVKGSIENAIEEHKKAAAEKSAKEQRTKNRVAELVNGFGMLLVNDRYERTSKHEAESEMSEYAGTVGVTVKFIETAEEKEWSERVTRLTLDYSKVKQVELAIQKRKDDEAEAARVALLSEKDKVEEYLNKLEAIAAPEVSDSLLNVIVLNIGSEFITARQRLQAVQTK